MDDLPTCGDANLRPVLRPDPLPLDTYRRPENRRSGLRLLLPAETAGQQQQAATGQHEGGDPGAHRDLRHASIGGKGMGTFDYDGTRPLWAYALAASPMAIAASPIAIAASPMSRKAATNPRLTANKPDIGVLTLCLLSIVAPFA